MYSPKFLIIPLEVIKDKKLPPVDKYVYGAILSASKLSKKKCIMSNQTIATNIGCSPSSVANSLVRLNKLGYVKTTMDDKNHRLFITPLQTYGLTQKELTNELEDTLTQMGKEGYSSEDQPLLKSGRDPYLDEEQNKNNTNKNKKENISESAPSKDISYLLNLPEADVVSLANTFFSTPELIRDEANLAYDYITAHGKKVSDYAAYLRSWLRRSESFVSY